MAPFWQRKTLEQMTRVEWESLCDGCAKCCLHKLEDEDTGIVYYTKVACRDLDAQSCRCLHYAERTQRVANCIYLTPADLGSFHWLPSSCAYRLLTEGKPLPVWHPLLSGDSESVHRAGISVRGKTVSESSVSEDDYEDLIVRWV